MAQYAAATKVSVEKSRGEIEKILTRWGATSFAYGWQGERAAISFAVNDRQIRFELPLPQPSDRRFTHTATGQKRAPAAAQKEYEQGVRQRWRALVLAIKAKLEAVEAGISNFENEFLAWTVLPGGATVADHVQPAIAEAYETGTVAPLLALGPGGD
jgi:hypothetical protein